MEDGWHASQLGLQAAPLASAVAGLSTASPPPEVTMIPMATAGPCYTNCQMVMPFMVLLFFMTLVVAVTQVNQSEKCWFREMYDFFLEKLTSPKGQCSKIGVIIKLGKN